MLKGDSKDYNLLAKWVEQLSPRDFYLSVEIGVREGYGSHVIMENLKNKNHLAWCLSSHPYNRRYTYPYHRSVDTQDYHMDLFQCECNY